MRRVLRVGALFVLVVVAPLVASLIALAVYDWCFQPRVDKELARIRAAGEPTTLRENWAYMSVPAGVKDCTELWLKALVPEREEAAPWEVKPASELLAAPVDSQDLIHYPESLRLMHEAAENGGAARFPREYSAEKKHNLEELKVCVIRGAHLLTVEGRNCALQGDSAGVAKSIRTSLSLGTCIQSQGELYFHGIHLRTSSAKTLEEYLSVLDFTDDDLGMLAGELQRAPGPNGLERFILLKRVEFLHMWEQGWYESEIGRQAEVPYFRAKITALALEEFARILAAARSSPMALHSAQIAARTSEVAAGSPPLASICFGMSRLTQERFLGLGVAAAKDAATLETMRAAIATRRFQRAHGRDPGTLDELVPEFLPTIPTDPADGQPLRFKTDENGILFYSFGLNGKDERGIQNDDVDDVYFRLTRSGKPLQASSDEERR